MFSYIAIEIALRFIRCKCERAACWGRTLAGACSRRRLGKLAAECRPHSLPLFINSTIIAPAACPHVHLVAPSSRSGQGRALCFIVGVFCHYWRAPAASPDSSALPKPAAPEAARSQTRLPTCSLRRRHSRGLLPHWALPILRRVPRHSGVQRLGVLLREKRLRQQLHARPPTPAKPASRPHQVWAVWRLQRQQVALAYVQPEGAPFLLD